MSLSLSTLQTTLAPVPSEVALRFAERQALVTCDWSFWCDAGLTCAVNTVYNVHGCCAAIPCIIPTTCLNSADVATACDDECQRNPLTAKCTYYESPACFTGLFQQNPTITGYGCAPTPYIDAVYTTNSDEIGLVASAATFGLSAAVPTSASNAASTTSNPDNGGGGGLSTSDKIALGCGIGIPVPALIVALLAWWFPRHQKRTQETNPGNVELVSKAEPHSTEIFGGVGQTSTDIL